MNVVKFDVFLVLVFYVEEVKCVSGESIKVLLELMEGLVNLVGEIFIFCGWIE